MDEENLPGPRKPSKTQPSFPHRGWAPSLPASPPPSSQESHWLSVPNVPCSEPLHLLYPLPKMLFPQLFTGLTPYHSDPNSAETQDRPSLTSPHSTLQPWATFYQWLGPHCFQKCLKFHMRNYLLCLLSISPCYLQIPWRQGLGLVPADLPVLRIALAHGRRPIFVELIAWLNEKNLSSRAVVVHSGSH